VPSLPSGILDIMLIREPFQFVFKGYSVWLELAQTDSDLEEATAHAALEKGLFPIASPHVTVIYGVSHLSEEEALRRFREKVSSSIKHWPALNTEGSYVGVSYDGVDGEEMVGSFAVALILFLFIGVPF
jgi:hypothetical protein